jgi:hypothetical protein
MPSVNSNLLCSSLLLFHEKGAESTGSEFDSGAVHNRQVSVCGQQLDTALAKARDRASEICSTLFIRRPYSLGVSNSRMSSCAGRSCHRRHRDALSLQPHLGSVHLHCYLHALDYDRPSCLPRWLQRAGRLSLFAHFCLRSGFRASRLVLSEWCLVSGAWWVVSGWSAHAGAPW